MKLKHIASAFLIIGAVSATEAAPITYDFTITFDDASPNAPSNKFISGSFTLDGSTITAIDLTIESHTYALDEVGYLKLLDGIEIIGGTHCNPGCIENATTDFLLQGDFVNSKFSYFYYSSLNNPSLYFSETGTLTARISDVPVPSAVYMLAPTVLGLMGAARKRR